MNKLQFMRLWDLYSKLLTPTQQEITNLYFNLDLTVSEIAESKGITRQGVSECLNGCKKQLSEYERKLGHERMLTALELQSSLRVKEIALWAGDFVIAHPELAKDVSSLTAILNKDYQSEVALLLDDKAGNRE